jgi:hypothetical protein
MVFNKCYILIMWVNYIFFVAVNDTQNAFN